MEERFASAERSSAVSIKQHDREEEVYGCESVSDEVELRLSGAVQRILTLMDDNFPNFR